MIIDFSVVAYLTHTKSLPEGSKLIMTHNSGIVGNFFGNGHRMWRYYWPCFFYKVTELDKVNPEFF